MTSELTDELRHYTLDEVAGLTNIPTSTIKRLTRARRVPYQRYGRAPLMTLSQIAELVATCKQEAEEPKPTADPLAEERARFARYLARKGSAA